MNVEDLKQSLAYFQQGTYIWAPPKMFYKFPPAICEVCKIDIAIVCLYFH